MVSKLQRTLAQPEANAATARYRIFMMSLFDELPNSGSDVEPLAELNTLDLPDASDASFDASEDPVAPVGPGSSAASSSHLPRPSDDSRALRRLPKGPRSRLGKKLAALERQQAVYDAVANAWDGQQLRHGELLQRRNDSQGEPAMGQKLGQHPNAWTPTGCVRLAFSNLFTTSAHHNRGSSHIVDALAATSFAATTQIRKWVKFVTDALLSNNYSAQWVFIQKAWDETPGVFSFGLLSESLAPMARYYWRDKSAIGPDRKGVWRQLTYEEFKAMGLAKNVNSGVLELMATKVAVHFNAGFADEMPLRIDQALAMPPVVIQRTNGSTIFNVLENICPGLGWDDILRLASHLDIVVLALTGDSASSNLRAKCEYRERATRHNIEVHESGAGRGYILLLSVSCCSHAVHNIVTHAFSDDLIPSLHATAHVFRHTGNFNALFRALAALVDEELEVFDDTPPPARYARHTAHLLNLSLLRPLKIRGREGGAAHDEEQLLGIAGKLKQMCNGDLRARTLTHFCPAGCCYATGIKSRRAIAVEKTVAALSDAWFNGLGSQCSKNKWYTFEPVLTKQLGGMLWSNVLPRAVLRMDLDSGSDPDEVANVADLDDWAVHNSRKKKKSLEVMGNRDSPVTFAIAAFVTAPVDKLSKRLQHLDEQPNGQTLVELTDNCRGPLQAAQQQLFSAMELDGSSWVPLSCLLDHFNSVSRHGLISRVKAAVLNVSAQLWLSIECCFWEYPWTLVRLANPRYSDEKKRKIREAFFQASFCDLDEEFSLPLRLALSGPADLEQPTVLQLLDRLSKCAKATNMGLEHLLSEVMSSTRHSRHKPTVERVVYSGQLAQLMHQHVSQGHTDSRQVQRKRLVSQKVPIRANKAARVEPSRGTTGVRRHFRFINAHVAEFMQANPGTSHKAARKHLAAQWRSMSPDDQEEAIACLPAAADADADAEDEGQRPAMDTGRADLLARFSLDIGDSEWPVSWQHVVRALDEAAPSKSAPLGLERIQRLRHTRRANLYYRDEGHIPDTKTFALHPPCHVRHHGLCVGDPFYEKVLSSAKALERACSKDNVGKYILIFDSTTAGTVECPMVLFLANVRQRRQLAQTTHSFARCEVRGDVVRFGQRADPDNPLRSGSVFDFVTPWECCKLLWSQSNGACTSLSFAVLEHATHEATFAATLEPPDQLCHPVAPVEFFPAAKVPAKPKAKPDALDSLLDRAPREKKLRQHIKKAPPSGQSLRKSVSAAEGVAPTAAKASKLSAAPVVVGEELPPGLTSEEEEEDEEAPEPTAPPAPPAPAPAPGEEQTDLRGPLHCLPDGRQYHCTPKGFIYGVGRWSPAGRLTSFLPPSTSSWLSTNFSMNCKMHARCKLIKTARALGNTDTLDDSALVAWLLDGMAPAVGTAEQHRQIWEARWPKAKPKAKTASKTGR